MPCWPWPIRPCIKPNPLPPAPSPWPDAHAFRRRLRPGRPRPGRLGRLDAATASARLRPGNETVASHTNHVHFLVDLHNRFERGEQPHADWAGSWTNQVVDDAAWAALRADLRAAYTTVRRQLEQRQEWPDEGVSAYIMLVAHCAYHLGEIRQMLTSVQK